MGLWFYVQEHPPSKHNQSGHYRPASETPSKWRFATRQADSGPRLDDGWAKAQPAVVLTALSLIRQTGRSQESNPDPLVYKAYANGDVILLFVAEFLGYNQ